MSTATQLIERSNGQCELCGDTNDLVVYEVPISDGSPEQSVLVCATCFEQIHDSDKIDPRHWRCLNDSMWSSVPAVQVMAWRMLVKLRARGESWTHDLIDMLYLDDASRAWAESGLEADDTIKHVDCFGATLQAGDSVTLIKDLDVKGSSLTAKRGTAVRNIRLVADNHEQIEGKVEGQQIVILTKFVKKSS